MSKKKSKKSKQKEGSLDALDNKPSCSKTTSNKTKACSLASSTPSSEKRKWKSEETGICNIRGQLEFQRFKGHKYVEEKKQKPSSYVPQGTIEGFQGESSNDSKTISAVLIQTEKRKRISIRFKQNDVKHGREKSQSDSGVVPTNRESCKKDYYFENDGTGGKMVRHSFAIQKDKLRRKKEKTELSKLKARVEQTMLEKFKVATSPTDLLSKKLHGSKKLSSDFRILQKPSATFPKTAGDGSFPINISHTSSKTCKKKKHLQNSKELSNKNHHDTKHMPSFNSTATSHEWQYLKEKKQHPDSSKTVSSSRTEGRTFEAIPLHLRQSSEVPCPSASHQAIQITETDQEMQIIEDLHAARIDKKMALPVVQTCGELTSMEIDLPEENADIPAATATSGLNLLIVIDTNIMISHLQFIMTLKTSDIPGIGRLALIIPWVVLQELDNLKKGKVLQHVRHKAVPAVEFIYTCLKNQDSKLWGQSMQLASQKIYGLSDENNDDRVLQCCLQYQSLFPQAFVILCTDDKNLCSKALVSDVKALCKADLVTALQNLNVNSHENCIGLQQSKTDTGSQKTKREDPSLTTPLLSIVPDLEKSLGEALSSILETEMKIAFGNLWMEVLYLKPPWTLASLLQCFKKHWMAVFGYIVPRSLLATIECLHEHLCKGKTVDHITANILLQESKKLLHAFSSRSDYDGVLPQAFAYVTKLLQMLAEVQSDSGQKSSEALTALSENTAGSKMEDVRLHLQTCEEGKSLSNTQLSQDKRHQEIWSVLERIWNTINLYSTEIFQKLDHNIITTTTAKISSFEEAFLGLQKLMAAVKNILAGIRRVLTPNSSFQDIWMLYNFLISNEINTSIKFTAEELYECVSQEVYRERLTVGCCQLAQLEYTITQCNASVHMEAKNRGWL
ncbi:transcriptional protein SWT1 isoform X1 [Dermochelys coriacea]|uniref:transcriptional protein SWT1 isoform X1 n=1 Tax=Dermochelys coriacea TaxID=27794 RepID=UPI0018E6F4DF|nr:transcriptional protein SWT1 isoform X1 [Dermochelys coriacea]XP_038270863.1 transcriptional protein SWT1 isoform X1 [Dermochelys coriacea]